VSSLDVENSKRLPDVPTPQPSRRWRLYVAVVLLLVVSLAAVGYALTSITINNTSTILPGQNIFITQLSTTNPTTCPTDGNVAYTNSPTSVAWTVTAGGSAQQQFFCIDNQGNGIDNPAISSSLSSGTCPSAGSTLIFTTPSGVPATLAPHTATGTPVTVGVCAGSVMAATATGPSFTITVT
jgi:hypothetical protein